MQTNATHGVRINSKNSNLIIEINCNNQIEASDYYERLIKSLIDILNQRSDDFASDTDTSYYILSFLRNILPNETQIYKLLS